MHNFGNCYIVLSFESLLAVQNFQYLLVILTINIIFATNNILFVNT